VRHGKHSAYVRHMLRETTRNNNALC
jgi:hypothetical protein